ncbi:hypothetical protein ACFZBU_42010 [Embleya sp. NPDC008237]|uniref:hypothetical protein n=1 Tax=Embleya sp. NPDC008237 TaxID=3363978 RepID=UPI0036EC4420
MTDTESYSGGVTTGVGERFKKAAKGNATPPPPPPAPAPAPLPTPVPQQSSQSEEPPSARQSRLRDSDYPALSVELSTPILTREEQIADVLDAVEAARRRRTSGATSRRAPVTVYVNDVLLKRIQAYQRRKQVELGLRDYDNGRVLLDAVTATFQELPGRVLDARAPKLDGLFEAYDDPTRAAEASNIPWQAKMAVGNRGIVDIMVGALGEHLDTDVSRSELLNTALDTFLPPLERKQFAGDRRRRKTAPTDEARPE